ncbi:MAG: TlpA family protein disulfide reductase [Planctomycetota bacterium]
MPDIKGLLMLLVWALLLAGTGCQREKAGDTIKLEPPDRETEGDETKEVDELWDDMRPEDAEGIVRRFIPADQADRVPEIRLQTFDGEDRSIRPFHGDKITILLFWSMDSNANRAAVVYANRLVGRYSRFGVAGIAVVEKPPTESHLDAPAFLSEQNIQLDVFYDDFEGLRRVAAEAGESVKWEVPCIFLIDSEGRVRSFRRGFSFNGSVADAENGSRVQVDENAPSGERVEDHLRRLLEEEDRTGE